MSRVKKNLFILHVPPPVHGSSIVGQLIMNSELINYSFECTYINLLVSRRMKDTGRISVAKLTRIVCVWVELMYSIIKYRPKYCYLALSTTGLSFYKDVLLILWLRIFKIQRVYHLHNKGVKARSTNFFINALYRFVFQDAKIILLSEQLYKDINSYVPETNVYICNNGIEDHFSKKNKFHNSKTVNLLFLSNMIDSKGVTVLLDACVILKERGCHFRCNFVGAEVDVNKLIFNEKVKERSLEKFVTYLGEKFDDDKSNAIHDADIFVLPTYYSNECFPLVLLEAMSAGLPIVTTFEGGISDIVDNEVTGFKVHQKDVLALADRLEQLIIDPILRLQMGKAGRVKFENDFTLEIFEQRFFDIITQITSGK